MTLNVLGTELRPCSYDPLTGYFRDGCCNTDDDDFGAHVICTRVTAEFLAYSKQRGNDLSTPRPEHRFRGLQPGDRWCLCAERWNEARQAEINQAQGQAAAILAVAEASAEAIRKIAEAIRSPGGEQAVQLKVAEKAVEAYAQLAQKNNTMIVPGNMSEVSALIGTAMTLLKSKPFSAQ